jgi:hypothetical protein
LTRECGGANESKQQDYTYSMIFHQYFLYPLFLKFAIDPRLLFFTLPEG